jgi:hypothetical protein
MRLAPHGETALAQEVRSQESMLQIGVKPRTFEP